MKDDYTRYLEAARKAARRGDSTGADHWSRRAERQVKQSERRNKAGAPVRRSDGRQICETCEEYERLNSEEARQEMIRKLDAMIADDQRKKAEEEARVAAEIDAQEEADAAWAQFLVRPSGCSS